MSLFFLSPSSSIWKLATYQEGSRFLIPEMCPATDIPPPLAGDQQLWVHRRSESSTSPNYISALLHRGYTSEATPWCVWYTCTLPFLCAYPSQQWVSHLFSKFWGWNQQIDCNKRVNKGKKESFAFLLRNLCHTLNRNIKLQLTDSKLCRPWGHSTGAIVVGCFFTRSINCTKIMDVDMTDWFVD